MTNFKQFLSRSAVRKAAVVLPAAALLCLAAPAMAGTADGAFASVYTVLNDMQGSLKGVVAIVGFIVALVSLIALRSFTAVLFFLGLAVFGTAGLSVASTIMGGTLSLL